VAKSVIKKPTQNRGDIAFTASSIEDFFQQILDLVRTYGTGSYTLGVHRNGYYYCIVSASVQSNTRCSILVTPQPQNDPHIYSAGYHNGTYTYKQVALTDIT
jgi:hypothetical protein